jgi:hypothetical protein
MLQKHKSTSDCARDTNKSHSTRRKYRKLWDHPPPLMEQRMHKTSVYVTTLYGFINRSIVFLFYIYSFIFYLDFILTLY